MTSANTAPDGKSSFSPSSLWWLMPTKETNQEWTLPRGHEERETFHINHSPLLPTLPPPLSYHLINASFKMFCDYFSVKCLLCWKQKRCFFKPHPKTVCIIKRERAEDFLTSARGGKRRIVIPIANLIKYSFTSVGTSSVANLHLFWNRVEQTCQPSLILKRFSKFPW